MADFDPARAQRMAKRALPVLRRYFRSRIEGIENLPEGPFVGVGNHSGGVLMPDVALWLFEVHRLGRSSSLRVLAHDELLRRAPGPVRDFLENMGAMNASPDNAVSALGAGQSVMVYPGGDEDLFRSFKARNEIRFAGRRGYVRLALEAGVPIVPVVSVGAHESIFVLREGRRLAKMLGLDKRRIHGLPIILGPPFGIWLGHLPGYLPLPTQITLRVLEPINLPRMWKDDDKAMATADEHIQEAMQDALDEMSRHRVPLFGTPKDQAHEELEPLE